MAKEKTLDPATLAAALEKVELDKLLTTKSGEKPNPGTTQDLGICTRVSASPSSSSVSS